VFVKFNLLDDILTNFKYEPDGVRYWTYISCAMAWPVMVSVFIGYGAGILLSKYIKYLEKK
jgi:hypothetical protein